MQQCYDWQSNVLKFTDVNGNKATSLGLIAAAEKSGLQLFLGSYPITPATDILHELSKRKIFTVHYVEKLHQR